jgi:hypothetical protein
VRSGDVHDVGIAPRQRQHLVGVARDHIREAGEFLWIAAAVPIPVVDAEDAIDGADHLLRPRQDVRIEQAADQRAEHGARERRIFEARRLAEDPITLEELSGEFDISRERVRQIEVRAF